MGSYFTGIVVAVFVVFSVLGLLVYAQDSTISAIDAQTATLDSASLLSIAQDEAAENRLEAILQLADVPGDPAQTVPVMAKLSTDPAELVRVASAIVLGKIGPAGATHVRKMLESADELEISQACSALKEMGGAKMYLPLLDKWLVSDDLISRKRALFALQGRESDAVELIDSLVDVLDDPDFNIQCMACRVLETLGPDAMPAEQKILELFKNGNPSTRGWAAIVLGAIGPTDKTDAAQLLANNLETFLQIEKQRSLLGLALMGPEASSVEGQVRAAMKDENKHVMPHAAYALWRITGKADEPLAELGKWLDDPTYTDDSCELVGKMAAAAAPLVDQLIPKLQSPEPVTRELVAVALGNIGPAAANAKTALQNLLGDSDALIRYAAREAIKQIEAEPESK